MDNKPTIIVHGFRTTYEASYTPDGKPTGKMDRAVDWVEYSPFHAAMYTKVSERLDWLKPPASIRGDDQGIKIAAMRHKWAQIEPAYKAWKDGMEIPLDGTPLGVWPGINAGQAQAFQSAGIKTVEQVASMTDSMMSKVPLPGVRDLQKQAVAFLEATDRSSTANRLSDLEKQNNALQEQLAAAMELLEQQTKPKRGKAEAEAA